MLKIKIKKLNEGARLPEQQTTGAAGYDLYTAEGAEVLNARASSKATVVGLGFAMEIPQGYHAKIVLRSSTGANTKLRLSNQMGIIDADYRGEVKLLLDNIGMERIRITRGARIAQMLITQNVDVVFIAASKLSDTARGVGGVGSTGDK